MTSGPVKPPVPERVLIVKPSALGDVVTAMPVLRGLRRTFRRAHLAWLVSQACAPLIAHDSDLDECVIFDRRRLGRAWRSPAAGARLLALLRRLRSAGYDWVLDLQGLLRSGLLGRATAAPLRAGFADARECASLFYTHRFSADPDRHTVDRNIALARQLGIDARPEEMTLQVAGSGRDFAEGFVRDHGLSGGFLVCVPPTRWRTKQYPVRHWRTVVSGLAKSVPVVLLGAQGDRALCEAVAAEMGPGVIDAAGRTDVAQMVGLIAACSGVVCCDSAAKFIAPAVGVDVVVLIGPTRLCRTGPYLRGRGIVASVPCQGCLKRRCRHITCMELIDPAEVISAAEAMLAAEGP